MTFAGTTISSLIGSLWAAKSHDVSDLPSAMPSSARVTKAELQDLFDIDGSNGSGLEMRKASERHQRQTTEMIREAMYKSD